MRKGLSGPGANAGPSINELAWQRMDELTDKVMSGQDDDKTVGRAIGVSEILAIFTNPYRPNAKAIRTEAKRRWLEKNRG